MDFIERIFGFAPDGGDGSWEFLLFAIPVAGIAYLLWAAARKTAQHVDTHDRTEADGP
jgi:hypothetical protein